MVGARFRLADQAPSARVERDARVGGGDLVLVMGAGDVRRLGDELAHAG